MKKMLLSSISFCALCLGVPLALASQGEGHTVSQNPKAPLTGEQLNALPPEVQANISRMMEARPTDTLKNPDGTKSRVYEVQEPNAQKYNELDKRREDYFALHSKGHDVAPAGTPIAEEAMNHKGYERSPDRHTALHKVHISNAGQLKELVEKGHPEQLYFLTFENPLEVMEHYEAYQPYLRGWLTLDLKHITLAPQDLKARLLAFVQKVNMNPPEDWSSGNRLVKLTVRIPYELVKDLLPPQEQQKIEKHIIEITKKEGHRTKYTRSTSWERSDFGHPLGITHHLDRWNFDLIY